jgi:hypothetical protein
VVVIDFIVAESPYERDIRLLLEVSSVMVILIDTIG